MSHLSKKTLRKKTARLFLEELESRLAPATLLNATTLTYQDVDGDNVTVAFSKPVLSNANANGVFHFNTGDVSVPGDNTAPQQLEFIDLFNLTVGGPNPSGVGIKVAAVRSSLHGGDGFANIGEIDGGGNDLEAVSIHGDLGWIAAGDNNSSTPGLLSLTVQSLGRFGIGVLDSNIEGKLGMLTVKSDVVGAFLQVRGSDVQHDADGKIGSITIGGSLLGGATDNRGSIRTTGDIGAVLIGGDVIGGLGNDSGEIFSNGGSITSVTIGGSLIGSSGSGSAFIFSGDAIGPVKITGDVRGGDAVRFSGLIASGQGNIASLLIGGSLIGGSGGDSGIISSGGDIGPVKITGDVRGGASAGSGEIGTTTGKIASVTIGGSVLGGAGSGNADPNNNAVPLFVGGAGSIVSYRDIGRVIIGGSVVGSSGDGSGSVISLNGKIQSLVSGVLVGITLGGSLVGGGGQQSGFLFSGADMGPVKITGDVRGGAGLQSGGILEPSGKLGGITIGGSLVGGSKTYSGLIQSGGDMGRVKITGDMRGGDGTLSGSLDAAGKIASVMVGGSVTGGGGTGSGLIRSSGDMGSVSITGDVRGGDGDESAEIRSVNGKLAGVSIFGSLIGGGDATHDYSGTIFGQGDVGQVTITGDIRGGAGKDSGEVQSVAGKIASVTLGGSLVGGSQDNSGLILSALNMGPVKITGDVRGGTGQFAGQINSGGMLASVSVGGSLTGGSKRSTGEIFSAGAMGAVSITGDIRGGGGVTAGSIFTLSTLASVTVRGSLIGGTADSTGMIRSNGAMGSIKLAGNVSGGDAIINGMIDSTGYIQGLRIASVFVGGSVIAGRNDNANTDNFFLKRSGSIRAQNDLGPVTILGSLVGNETNRVIISARGQAAQTTTDLAIASLHVGGRVEMADILAGYDVDLNPVNGDAQIGAVSIGLDWIASNLVAGVMTTNGYFGDGNDVLIVDTSAKITASIASIMIGGQALGTPSSVNSNDHFGFVAELIGSLKVGGTSIPLKAGAHNDTVDLGATLDLTLVEVPHPI